MQWALLSTIRAMTMDKLSLLRAGSTPDAQIVAPHPALGGRLDQAHRDEALGVLDELTHVLHHKLLLGVVDLGVGVGGVVHAR